MAAVFGIETKEYFIGGKLFNSIFTLCTPNNALPILEVC